MYKKYFKRLLDIILSLGFLIIISPVFICITIILIFESRGNPFFVQARPGLREKVFYIIKFKTMNEKRDKNGELLPDKDRITRFGHFIRNSSLDEIPQCINVLAGDISLVGPRPLLVDYLPLYNDFQRKRHNVRPGITGWAQINGRNAIAWNAKFKLDVWYVDHISLKLDLKILFLTLRTVIKHDDVSKEGHATTVAFNGHN